MSKLWLDDVRPAPVGWTWARTCDEAIGAVEELWFSGGRNFEVMSLDHDLTPAHYRTPATDVHYGQGCYTGTGKTGMDFVNWLEESGHWPSHIVIHSMNPYGAMRMYQVCREYVPSVIQPYTGLER